MTKTKALVYILDDDPSFIYMMEHILKKLGLTIVSFNKKEDFLNRTKERLPELCLIDLNLSSPLQGFEIIESVRSFISTAVPIIIISSEADAESVTHALEIGANDYLLKPLDRQILISKVSNFVNSVELKEDSASPEVLLDSMISTSISIDARMIRIEETGVVLLSPHLVAKGAVLQLRGKIVDEIIGKDAYILASVSATSVDLDNQFNAYLEFDSSQPDVPNQVRTWILKKTAQATSQ